MLTLMSIKVIEGWLDKGYIYNTVKGDVIYYQPWQSNDLYKSYDKLKAFLKLKVLPELSPKQLTDFVNVYWSRIQEENTINANV